MKEIEYKQPEQRGIIPMKKNEVIEEPLIEEVTIATFLSGIEVTKNYNDNINVHLPQYLNFKPVQKVLAYCACTGAA